jgi:hypothetical protein
MAVRSSALRAGEPTFILKKIPGTFLSEAGSIQDRVVGRRSTHIFYTIGSQMGVLSSALRPGRPTFILKKILGTFLSEAESIQGPDWKDQAN